MSHILVTILISIFILCTFSKSFGLHYERLEGATKQDLLEADIMQLGQPWDAALGGFEPLAQFPTEQTELRKKIFNVIFANSNQTHLSIKTERIRIFKIDVWYNPKEDIYRLDFYSRTSSLIFYRGVMMFSSKNTLQNITLNKVYTILKNNKISRFDYAPEIHKALKRIKEDIDLLDIPLYDSLLSLSFAITNYLEV